MADIMSIDKTDLVKQDSEEESRGSTPECEQTQQGNSQEHQEGQENQPVKRKGGRKPIYATSEERKQRNRQAQAAFRERRTEYIKQLEETIRVHEQNLHSLQAAHRNAADECLMLRYKNSLLERILLEKGIDVQAELRAKTGSPNLAPSHMPQNLVQPPPLSRALLNRHHARRSNSSIAPKLEPGISPLPPPVSTPHGSAASPKSRHALSSHSASPANTTSAFGGSPAGSGSDHVQPPSVPRSLVPPTTMKAQPPPAPLSHLPGMAPSGPPRTMQQQMQAAQRHHAMRAAAAGGGVPGSTPFYQTPAFQNHIEQLEQEYDAAADMLDDPADPADTPGPGPYPGAPGPYSAEQHHHAMSLSSPTTTGTPIESGMGTAPAVTGAPHTHHGSYPSMTQLLDPGLDWDPFGLSASMAFPTQFSFDTSNMR